MLHDTKANRIVSQLAAKCQLGKLEGEWGTLWYPFNLSDVNAGWAGCHHVGMLGRDCLGIAGDQGALQGR